MPRRKNARELAEAVENKTVLAVCGGYQLLGKYYETAEGARLDFTGILDFYTVGREKRLIGNYEFKTKEKIRLIGFENHSGRTYLGPSAEPLGKVIKGFGNNGADKTEGVRYKSTFCTYAHGPLLPKNPDFADMLITSALQKNTAKSALLRLIAKQKSSPAGKSAICIFKFYLAKILLLTLGLAFYKKVLDFAVWLCYYISAQIYHYVQSTRGVLFPRCFFGNVAICAAEE